MSSLSTSATKLKDSNQSKSLSPVARYRSLSQLAPKDRLVLLANLAAVLGLVVFLFVSRQGSLTTSSTTSIQESLTSQVVTRPLDQVSSVQMAINLALLGQFDETYWLAEQAIDVAYLDQSDVSANPVVNKPQLVNTSVKTRKDIINYVVSAGDTIDDLAERFSVSANSIRWSNGITGNNLTAGQELAILPGFEGVVYKVKPNDTVTSILKRYQVPRAGLISFNDLIDNELPVDELIFLPAAQLKVTKPVVRIAVDSIGYTPLYGSSGYVWGHCTYYVATRINVPYGLGNANTWDDRAPSRGYTKTKTPQSGSIAQADYNPRLPAWHSGNIYGHVAYVEEVSADGSMIRYSDMNGLAGRGAVGYSGWVSRDYFTWYLVPPS